MSFLPDLNGEFCLRLTLTLLHFLWQGVAIALLAAGAGAALRHAGAAARYWVFVAALGAMALCPPITYHTLTRLEDAPQEAVPQTALPPETEALRPGEGSLPGTVGTGFAPVSIGNSFSDTGLPRTVDLSPGSEGGSSGTGAEAGLKPAPTEKTVSDASLLKRVSRSVSQAFASDAYARVAPWVAGGYFAGVLVMLARLFLALRGGRGLRRQSRPVTEPALRATIARAAVAFHLHVMPAVAWCERVAVPTVVGLLKPTILLPLSLSSGLSPEQVEMLLLHELAHLRRHDHWVNLAQWIVETAMFFHPAVWWVSRRIRAEREIACDDRVLAAGVDATPYADSLLRMAELSRLATTPSDPSAALALGSHGSRFSGFGHRVLRLIEGREALESLRPARVWPVAVALVVLLAGCYAIACRPEAPDTRQSNDPLGIQYRGLQVGLSDSLYNPQGEKIGERLNWQYGSGFGGPKEMQRRLIFDFPETPEPIFFEKLAVSCAGTRADKRAWEKKTKGAFTILDTPELREEMDGQTLQVIADIPFFAQKSQDDYLFPPVMDVVLSYYYGPPGKSQYRFSGPFRWDQTQNDRGGVLCPKKPDREDWFRFDQTHFFLKLETPLEKFEDRAALAYDRTGKRYPGHLRPRLGAALGEWYKDLEVTFNVPIGEIETITIGEKPYEVWVTGIQVTPPGSEEETRNEMAEMARVFEIPGMKYEQVRDYDFGANPDKALRALPLLRGFSLYQAVRATPPEKFRDQPPEFFEQLHQTALKLSLAPTPHWEHGIRMGIQGGWPECYSLVLDRLADPKVQRFFSLHGGGEGNPFFLLYSLSEHPQELPDDLTPKIQKVIGVGDNGPSMGLLKCLTDKKTTATTEALHALSRDERPSVWIAAFGELSTRKALAPEESLTPPEKVRLTVARALNGSLPEKTALEPEVESVLLAILSDGANNLRPTLVLDALHRYSDPKTTLRAAVEFLQKQNPYGHRINRWPIPTVTRWINQNYGVNIGELGTGSPNDTSYEEMPPTQLGKQITDACTWYEQSEYFNGTPLKRPFFQNSPEEQAGETKDGPLDIQFAGIQVGLGDSLYNQKGEKIGEHVNWTVNGPYEETPSWRFIFDLPETGSDAQYFKICLYRSDDGKRQGRLRTFESISEFGLALTERNGRQTQWVIEDRATPSAYDPGEKPPRSVDLVMQYYFGPPGESRYRFSGPFEIDKPQVDGEMTLSPLKDPMALPYRQNSLFNLKSGPGVAITEPVLIYDREGKRYRGVRGGGSNGSEGSDMEFRTDKLSLEDIALVTVGEKPRKFEVNGIRVDPAGAAEETQARLAQIAKALDLPAVTWNDLGQYNFATDREKTIRSLPFLQGGILVKAWQDFTNSSDPLNPVSPQRFSLEHLEIVHQTALKWSGIPAYCQYGIGMGLWGRWPEFYPMALNQRMGFNAIENHPQEMPDDQIPRILEILQTTEIPEEYRALMSCLRGKRSPATTEALRTLTQSDRPWLWVPAFTELWSRNVFTPNTELSPQDRLRLTTARVIYGGEPNLTSGEEIEPLLLSMLTPEAKRMSGVYFDIFRVLTIIEVYCNRENRTRAMVEYVQKADLDVRPLQWEIVHIVCWINRDYNVNISNLGTDPNKMSVPSREQLKQLASDLVSWHKTGVVPGGFTAEKPTVIEFPADSSLGTLQVGSKVFPAQGRIEIPVGSHVSLSIRQRPVSFAAVEQLKILKGFDIDLYGIRFPDDDFQYFRPLTNLRSFSCDKIDFSGFDFGNLNDFPNLKVLRLRGCQISDTSFSRFKVTPGLVELFLENNQLTDSSMERLQNLPALVQLNLGGNPVTSRGLVHLSNLTSLSALYLAETRIDDAGLENLKKLLYLHALYLDDTNITNAGLVHVGELKYLMQLYLNGTSVGDAGLDNLKKLPYLQYLGLSKTKVTDAGLSSLVDIPKLSTLSLGGTRITDRGLEVLKKQKTLTSLYLDETGITDAGLTQLSEMSGLGYLSLEGTAISDAAIETLKRFPNLRSLNLNKTRITVDGLAELRKQMPSCSIESPSLETKQKEGDLVSNER